MILGSENWLDGLVRKVSRPLARVLASNRFVTADRVSLCGIVLGGVACPTFALNGQWPCAASLFVGGNCADCADGDVARAQKTALKRRDILDGLIDRYVNFLVLMAMTLSAPGAPRWRSRLCPRRVGLTP